MTFELHDLLVTWLGSIVGCALPAAQQECGRAEAPCPPKPPTGMVALFWPGVLLLHVDAAWKCIGAGVQRCSPALPACERCWHCVVCTVFLQDLAAGYMSGKLLLKLDAIGFLLTHHTSGELGSCGCAGHCVSYPYVCLHAYCCSFPDQPRPTHARLVSVH